MTDQLVIFLPKILRFFGFVSGIFITMLLFEVVFYNGKDLKVSKKLGEVARGFVVLTLVILLVYMWLNAGVT